ncbi:hypothetical protein V8E54_010438 [Elaphomyces granulatus]
MTSRGAEANDWSNITDRTVKKRIQNRIAQRNYRIKMKQRLQYLEATIDRQRQKESVFERDTSVSSNHSGATIPPAIVSSSCDYAAIDLTGSKSSGLLSPCSPTSVRQSPEQYLNRSLHNDTEDPLPQSLDHSPSESTLHSPSVSGQPYNIPLSDFFLQNLSTSAASHTVPSFADPIHDYFPQNLISAINENMQSQASLLYCDYVLRQRGLPTGIDYLSETAPDQQYTHDYQQHRMNAFTAPGEIPWTATEEQFTAYNSSPVLKSELDSIPEEAIKRPVTSDSGNVNDSVSHTSHHHIPRKDASVAERLEYLLQCAHNVGFENFDSMISKYYAADFKHISSISNEQCLSRNLGLPRVLAELRKHSKSWTKWERQGYLHEILKTAEDIFVAETGKFQDTVFESGNAGDTSGMIFNEVASKDMGSECIPEMIRIFQNNVPSLWALVTTLSYWIIPTTRYKPKPHGFIKAITVWI